MRSHLALLLSVIITALFSSCGDEPSPAAPEKPKTLTITGFAPDSGATGTSVLISGANFHANRDSNAVFFGLHRAVVDSASASALRVHVPDLAATGYIIVRTSNGADTSDKPFRVITEYQQPAPFISDFTPDSGATGTSVLISGANFHANRDSNAVFFGLHRAVVDSASASALRARVPDSAATGYIIVRTSNGADTSDKPFRVITIHAAIADFTPKYGQISSPFTVFGSNLDNVTELFVGERRCSITLRTPDSLQARLPNDFTRSARLTAIAGNDTIRTKDSMFIEPMFRYPALNVTKGLPGSEVLLKVKNFAEYYANARVFFGKYEADILSRSETELKVLVPEEAQTAPIHIQTRIVTVSTGYNFTVLKPPPPVISSIFPENDTFNDTLTISGSNFGKKVNGWQVKIGTISAQITSMTPTTIKVVIPTTLTPGIYDVFVDYRGEIAKAPKQFEAVQRRVPRYLSGNVSFSISERIKRFYMWKESGQGYSKTDTTNHTLTLNAPIANCPPPSRTYFHCRSGIHNDTIEFCCPLSSSSYSLGEYTMIVIDTLNKKLKQIYINHMKDTNFTAYNVTVTKRYSIDLRLSNIDYSTTTEGVIIADISGKEFSNSIVSCTYYNEEKSTNFFGGSNWKSENDNSLDLLPFSTGNYFRLELRR